MVGEISPLHQRGAALGISNALFSLAGLIAPWVMGHIVDVGSNPAEGFRNGFVFAGAIVATGGVLAMLLINPERNLERFRKLAGPTKVDAMAPA
jgi:MFS family permease